MTRQQELGAVLEQIEGLAKRARELVEELPETGPSGKGATKRRPIVGDTVKIVRDEDIEPRGMVGRVGRILMDDESGTPYRVQFDDGSTSWFYESDVELVEEEPPQQPTFKVGDLVRLVQEVGRVGPPIGTIGVIRVDDGRHSYLRYGVEFPLTFRGGHSLFGRIEELNGYFVDALHIERA